MSGPVPFRFRWTDAVCDDASLSATAKHVALTLAKYMNRAGTCCPAVPTLARRTSRDPRTVQHAIAELVAARYLEVERGGGAGRTNTYYASFPPTGTPASHRRSDASAKAQTPASARETPASASENPGEMPPESSSEASRTYGAGEELDHVLGETTHADVLAETERFLAQIGAARSERDERSPWQDLASRLRETGREPLREATRAWLASLPPGRDRDLAALLVETFDAVIVDEEGTA